MDPAPPFTPAQRYFYEVNGYVQVPGVFAAAECRRFAELAAQMDADEACAYKHEGYPKTLALTVLSRCAWYHPHLLETALHPQLLPRMEDLIGGQVRLEEHQFLINYPDPDHPAEPGQSLDLRDERWHRGIDPGVGIYRAPGKLHTLFAKALIYLTANGPGEGTWVVPGSHLQELPTSQLRPLLDPSLARQLQASPGDVLFFSEALIHSLPRMYRGSPPRLSLVYGYTASFMQAWSRYDPPAEVVAGATPEQRQLLTGEARYNFRSGKF
ncbi:MAG: phytanoyl-CoA dioxygenase family protein [Candidatus Latescibacteria bacterium]|nr:phytanoyl-CoA dioxygenase family protein [Candidatus Latescibacterota bacterium]